MGPSVAQRNDPCIIGREDLCDVGEVVPTYCILRESYSEEGAWDPSGFRSTIVISSGLRRCFILGHLPKN